MTKRATVDDFPIGCTVKVVRLPKSDWRAGGRYPDLIGAIGKVSAHYPGGDGEGPWVDVIFDPMQHMGSVFRPWWLERGRVEWIPDASIEVVP